MKELQKPLKMTALEKLLDLIDVYNNARPLESTTAAYMLAEHVAQFRDRIRIVKLHQIIIEYMDVGYIRTCEFYLQGGSFI